MGRSCNLLFVLVVFILLHTSLSSTVLNISTDEAVLLAFKSHISYVDPNNILTTHWSSSRLVCNWIGISCCSRHHRVATLDISNMQLYGTIPPHLENLSFLVSISIDNNSFHGEFPKELAYLQRLKLISVRRNNFTGAIPTFLREIIASISNMSELQKLGFESNRLSVMHGDLKPSNVLQDQEMVVHVSDFGIAKLLGAGKTFVQTRTIATIGYIAPEYGQDGILSMSCDVYSFGILMIETFTRIRPGDERFIGDLSIRRWVSYSFPNEIHKVVDTNLVQLSDEQIDAKM
ncbi:putative receptor-like protein kinase At3g47110 [Solanum stenotomum]|uniref:putative receptor-like protein kinase At3g47110 n=1 Tax=Solanum stenotomum TaxID=172797 RepID=UPI0020D15BC8|nr:putative receptor-like protein kinase At3g47110 [Solanum stenotomum]